MTRDALWAQGDRDAQHPGSPEPVRQRTEPPAIQIKMPDSGRPDSERGSQTERGGGANAMEGLLQRVIERMEESDRRYGQALVELQDRLEELSRQAQSRHEPDAKDDAMLEAVRSGAASLAERLRKADPSTTAKMPAAEASRFREIEERISAFAERMKAPATIVDVADIDEEFAPEPGRPTAPPKAAAAPSPDPIDDFEPAATGLPPSADSAEEDDWLNEAPPRTDAFAGRARQGGNGPAWEATPDPSPTVASAWADDADQPRGVASTQDALADGKVLKDIEDRLAALARYFDDSEQQRGRLDSVERHLLHLIELAQSSGSQLDAVAQKAAQAALRLAAEQTDGKSAGRLDAIHAAVSALDQRARALDERLADVLRALEDGLRSSGAHRSIPRPGHAHGIEADLSQRFRAESGPVPPEQLDLGAHKESRVSAAGDRSQPRPSRTDPAEQQREPTGRSAASSEDASAARRSSDRGRSEPAFDDADFIASARRAAQAAARQAEQKSSRLSLFQRNATASAKTSRVPDEAPETRRPRRLLVFAAVLLLVISAALLYGRLKSLPPDPAAAPTSSERTTPERALPPQEQTRSSMKAPAALPASAPIRFQIDPTPPQAERAEATTSIARKPAAAAPDSIPPLPGTLIVTHGQGASGTAPDRRDGKPEAETAAPAPIRDLERNAAQGDASAQFRLASAYERGEGVARDRERAKVWYMRAAQQGHVGAMHNLAVILADGGAAADYTAAAKWFAAAADHGLADSQFNLGILYQAGLGVDRDMVEAFKWFSLAAAGGDQDAKTRAEQVRLQLSEQQLAAAEQAIASWKPKPAAARTTGDRKAAAAAPGGSEQSQGEASVLAAQKLLATLGYDVGPQDGLLGPKTESAIRLFEERVGLPVTGRMSPELLARLRARTQG